MPIRVRSFATLVASVAFVFVVTISLSSLVRAQAPIVDASVTRVASENRQALAPDNTEASNSSSGQGELFYQLQLLQQEVMQLRGIVEEQSHQLKQLNDQNIKRYVDVDKRLSELATMGPSATAANGNVDRNSNTLRPVSDQSQTAAQEGEKAAYDAAYSLVVNKRFYEALEAFKGFLNDFPVGKYAPNCYYWMGELYQVVKPQDLEAARQAFVQLLQQYPSHSKVPDAMYKLGKVYYLKDNKTKSREWLEKVIAEYGHDNNSSAADKARQFVNANF
jgi:tol-pal system protein YbgF